MPAVTKGKLPAVDDVVGRARCPEMCTGRFASVCDVKRHFTYGAVAARGLMHCRGAGIHRQWIGLWPASGLPKVSLGQGPITEEYARSLGDGHEGIACHVEGCDGMDKEGRRFRTGLRLSAGARLR